MNAIRGSRPDIPPFVARRAIWLLPLMLWALLVGVSLVHQLADLRQQSLDVATEGARNMFKMVVMTRAWNAKLGGVYASVTEHVQPNPYLQHPRRDLVTRDGMRLTMINPAYMTRLVAELAQKENGAVFHITSLRPIRPGNAADPWEARALSAFEQGRKEYLDVLPGTAGQGRVLRYMAPLKVTAPCMACHAMQGYRVGDIRGGISVTLPYEPIAAASRISEQQAYLKHIAVFLLVAAAGGGLLEMLRRRWIRLAGTIKELRTTQEALLSSNESLRVAQKAAESASAAKSAFLANMSHELRTPLNAIDGMAYLVRREGLTPDQAERMNKLEQASRNLLALIDRVLQLARLEDGKLELSPVVFSLPLLVRKVLDLVGDSAREKGLTLTLDFPDMPERLRGDVAYISQILLNYLGNAIKFTQQGSVTLVGRVREETDKDLLIRFDVQDTGIGLNEEQMARLFTAFEQGDNSNTRNYGGSGLGLAINYRLARLMGGEVGVESTPGKGSSFWFTVRLAKVPPMGDSSGAAAIQPQGGDQPPP